MFFNRRQTLLGLTAVFWARPAFAATEVGIIFIGASWCSVCKSAAPMLALYSETHDIPVLVASGDDRPISPFEEFTAASKHPIAASIQKYPTTLVFSSVAQTVVGAVEGYQGPTRYFNSINGLINAARAL